MFDCNKCMDHADCKSREAFERLTALGGTGSCSGYKPEPEKKERKMRYKEMTREEVIEALEYCASEQCDCSKCKLYVADDDACDCSRHLKLKAVELMKMQQNDDEGIYLIFKDSMDDYCEIVGYIKGTEEKAEEYCRKHNEKQKHRWRLVEYEALRNLEDVPNAEDHPAIVDRETWEAAQAKIKEQNEREGAEHGKEST